MLLSTILQLSLDHQIINLLLYTLINILLEKFEDGQCTFLLSHARHAPEDNLHYVEGFL